MNKKNTHTHLDNFSVEEIAPQQLHLSRLLIQLVVRLSNRLGPKFTLQSGLLAINVAPLGLYMFLFLTLPVLLRNRVQ